MFVMGLGLDRSGRPLFPPVEESALTAALAAALQRNGERVRRMANATLQTSTFRSKAVNEIVRKPVDPADVTAVGWTYLVRADDPKRAALDAAIRPLAIHRGMADPGAPLLYNGEPADSWFEWVQDSYFALKLEGKIAPRYILIVGGPEKVPLGFQAFLDTVADVGRVDFDSIDDLRRYVAKVIRVEKAAEPTVGNEAVFFAPDGGPKDPTFFSRAYMAQPLADHVRDRLNVRVTLVDGDEATKEKLIGAVSGRRPALVFTASHGLGETRQPLAVQKKWNGAICCQHRGELTEEALFAGHDVPAGGAFCEGAVFFQFACFGYGTPACSDYTHWLEGVPERYAEHDFVGALPKALLAHERGPVAFVGHLDTAFLHAFTDPQAPHALARWNARISPFKTAIERFLEVQPSGYAMEEMNDRYSICNAVLTTTYDSQQRGTLKWTDALKSRFLDTWITRSDAQNYMVYGDPAVRLRIARE